MDRTKLRAQVALATAVSFASLAVFAHRPPAAQDSGCDKPAWALLNWGASDCR